MKQKLVRIISHTDFLLFIVTLSMVFYIAYFPRFTLALKWIIPSLILLLCFYVMLKSSSMFKRKEQKIYTRSQYSSVTRKRVPVIKHDTEVKSYNVKLEYYGIKVRDPAKKLREIEKQDMITDKRFLKVQNNFFENSKRYKQLPKFIPEYKLSDFIEHISCNKNCLTCRFSDLFFTENRLVVNCKKRSSNSFYIFKFWSRPCWQPDGEWIMHQNLGKSSDQKVEVKSGLKIML